MAEEVVTRFSKIKLGEREAVGVVLVTDDVLQRKQECDRSLLGKVWGAKAANFQGLKSTMNQLWCHKRDLKVLELGYNFYQFVFTDKVEKERVLQKKPWFFDNQIVVLHPWQPSLSQNNPLFNRSQCWVQIKGLPNHWISKTVGWKLGKLFHDCFNVTLSESGSKEGLVLKMLVEFDLDQPLLRGTNIQLEQEKIWADFQYEQLPTFCFYCGIVGHQERSCEQKFSDSRTNSICEGQYGEWVRASLPKGGNKGGLREKAQRKDGGNIQDLVVAQEARQGSPRGDNGEPLQGEALGNTEGVKSQNPAIRPGHLDQISASLSKVQPVRVGGSKIETLLCKGSSLGEEMTTTLDCTADVVDSELMNNLTGLGDSMIVDPEKQVAGDPQRILQEIGNSILNQKDTKTRELTNPGKGQWKRLARAGKGLGVNSLESKQEIQACHGSKRLLSQGSEVMEEQTEKQAGKKLRTQGKENERNCLKLEVASLEWP